MFNRNTVGARVKHPPRPRHWIVAVHFSNDANHFLGKTAKSGIVENKKRNLFLPSSHRSS